MKQFFFAAFSLVLFALSGVAQAPCKEHSEPKGIFTICQPEGWAPVAATPERKYRSIRRIKSPTAQISFAERTDPASVYDFGFRGIANVFASKAELEISNVRVISAGDFTTASGEKGIRFLFALTSEGVDARNLTFIFQAAGDTKLQIASTSTAADTLFESEVDAALKTLKIKK
jgi:hypothetical protein